MQIMYATFGERTEFLEFPAPEENVLPGIAWGRFDDLFTPAYWRGQVWQHTELGTYDALRIGRTLAEEIAACVLGGYGMRAELGLAAFERLRDLDLLGESCTEKGIVHALATPFIIRGKAQRYRFPRQKARYLAACLKRIGELSQIENDLLLRTALCSLPGIGPKTASWIVRNYLGSDSVAVLDVHIMRAGKHIRLFPEVADAQRDYYELERSFLVFSEALGARPAILDAVIWDYMRRLRTSGIPKNQ